MPHFQRGIQPTSAPSHALVGALPSLHGAFPRPTSFFHCYWRYPANDTLCRVRTSDMTLCARSGGDVQTPLRPRFTRSVSPVSLFLLFFFFYLARARPSISAMESFFVHLRWMGPHLVRGPEEMAGKEGRRKQHWLYALMEI